MVSGAQAALRPYSLDTALFWQLLSRKDISWARVCREWFSPPFAVPVTVVDDWRDQRRRGR